MNEQDLKLTIDTLTNAEIPFTVVDGRKNYEDSCYKIVLFEGRSCGIMWNRNKLTIKVDEKNIHGKGFKYGALSYDEEREMKSLEAEDVLPNCLNKPKNFKKQFFAHLEIVKKREEIYNKAGLRIEALEKQWYENIERLKSAGFNVDTTTNAEERIDGTAHVRNKTVSFELDKYGSVRNTCFCKTLTTGLMISLFWEKT